MDASEERETLEAVTGQEVEVALESFPGSGAIWHHHNAAPEILELLGETRTAADKSIGGAVRQSCRFTSHQPGSSELSFELKRPWEQEVRRRKTFVVRVA
jgi:hypothetical protein